VSGAGAEDATLQAARPSASARCVLSKTGAELLQGGTAVLGRERG
jgi:hypothetical protein